MIKWLFFSALFALCSIHAAAQTYAPMGTEKARDVKKLQVKPQYPGGMDAFNALIANNIQVPPSDTAEDKTVKVYVSFVIEKDGTLGEIRILQDPGYGLGEEAKRVLLLSKKWAPGVEKGKPVRSAFSIPITVIMKGTGKPEPEQKKE